MVDRGGRPRDGSRTALEIVTAPDRGALRGPPAVCSPSDVVKHPLAVCVLRDLLLDLAVVRPTVEALSATMLQFSLMCIRETCPFAMLKMYVQSACYNYLWYLFGGLLEDSDRGSVALR